MLHSWPKKKQQQQTTGHILNCNSSFLWWIVFVVWLTDQRHSLISSRGHCQTSSPSRISDTPQTGQAIMLVINSSTSFRLNIVNFQKTLPPAPPLNPPRGSQCPQTPSKVLFPNTYKTQNFFPLWLTPCWWNSVMIISNVIDIMWSDKILLNIFSLMWSNRPPLHLFLSNRNILWKLLNWLLGKCCLISILLLRRFQNLRWGLVEI